MLRVTSAPPTHAANTTLLVPRAVWRKLLLTPPLPTSSRVIFAGAHPLEDAKTLAALPLDVCVFCADVRETFSGRQDLPSCEIYPLSQVTRRIPEHTADLIVLRDLPAFESNLFNAAIRQQTAELLSLLKPSSRLVFLHRNDGGFGHQPDCWVRHLACFPGRIEHEETWDSLFDWSRWELFGPREHRPTTHLISITIPAEPLTASDWHDYARHGLLTSQRTCCAAAAATMPDAARIRRAA